MMYIQTKRPPIRTTTAKSKNFFTKRTRIIWSVRGPSGGRFDRARETGHFVKEAKKFRFKAGFSKPKGGCTNRIRVERSSFKLIERRQERIDRLFLEQDSSETVRHNFSGAPTAEGDDALSASLCFGHNDAKVFLSSEDERFAPLHCLSNNPFGLRSQ